jgi:hypothetical protein
MPSWEGWNSRWEKIINFAIYWMFIFFILTICSYTLHRLWYSIRQSFFFLVYFLKVPLWIMNTSYNCKFHFGNFLNCSCQYTILAFLQLLGRVEEFGMIPLHLVLDL